MIKNTQNGSLKLLLSMMATRSGSWHSSMTSLGKLPWCARPNAYLPFSASSSTEKFLRLWLKKISTRKLNFSKASLFWITGPKIRSNASYHLSLQKFSKGTKMSTFSMTLQALSTSFKKVNLS